MMLLFSFSPTLPRLVEEPSLAHMNQTWKLLLKTEKSDISDFIDSGDNQGHHQRLMRGLFFGQATSDPRVGKDHGKLKELQRWLLDLIEGK
jgi:hypothetical protein